MPEATREEIALAPTFSTIQETQEIIASKDMKSAMELIGGTEEEEFEEAPQENLIQNEYWLKKQFVMNNIDKPNFIPKMLAFRQRLNMDTIVIVVGAKRTGKSYGAITIAEKVAEINGKKFDVEKDLFFELKPFLIKFRDAVDDIFVLDEVSVNYSNRDWQDIQHKIFNAHLTTQGFRRNILILTLPSLWHLDKRAVDLSHYILRSMFTKGNFRCYQIASTHTFKDLGAYPFYWLNLQGKLPSKENLLKYEKIKKSWNDARIENDILSLDILENPESYKKKFDWNFYLNCLKVGIITPAEFTNHLEELNFRKSDIELAVKSQEKSKELQEQKQYDPFMLNNSNI